MTHYCEGFALPQTLPLFPRRCSMQPIVVCRGRSTGQRGVAWLGPSAPDVAAMSPSCRSDRGDFASPFAPSRQVGPGDRQGWSIAPPDAGVGGAWHRAGFSDRNLVARARSARTAKTLRLELDWQARGERDAWLLSSIH
mmetsp:Transcript_31657/g.72447  ORF Transcript_31657/g.72447 Transcript_31657/m.72447 type:complete len:139 (-) Transcript_31657:9-425(-)